jgi:hypothetical protein
VKADVLATEKDLRIRPGEHKLYTDENGNDFAIRHSNNGVADLVCNVEPTEEVMNMKYICIDIYTYINT